MKTTITDKQISAYFELQHDTLKVTIRRDGYVVVRKRRDDGATWDMFAGRRDDVAGDVARFIAFRRAAGL